MTLRSEPLAVRSMTGFASVRTQTSAGELTVTLRTVNGRNLDLHFHLNSEFAPFENALRALLKEKFGRGHVEIRMSLAISGESAANVFNQGLLARYLSAFRIASTEFHLDGKPDLNVLLGLPGVLDSPADAASSPVTEAEIVSAVASCADELNRFREREGSELLKAVLRELDAIETATQQILEVRSHALPELQSRLNERLNALLADAGINPARLVEEAAILADRSDIQEELTRLQVHAQELRRMLTTGGQIGKRADFLLQEMNREINTVLSKSSGIGPGGLGVTNLGIGVKANIERIREQALNLE